MGCAASSNAEYGQYSTLGYNNQTNQQLYNNTTKDPEYKTPNSNGQPAGVPADEKIYGENIDFSEDQKRLEERQREQEAQENGGVGNQNEADGSHEAAAAAALLAARQQEEERRLEDERRRREEEERIQEENRKRQEEQEREEELAKQNDADEAAKAAALAKQQAEDEARMKQEEEQRKQAEEEERRKQEEEERKKREEEEEQQARAEPEGEPLVPIAAGLVAAEGMDEFDSPKPPEFGADYVKNDLGIYEVHMDFRSYSEPIDHEERPMPNEGNLFVDYDFPLNKAVPEKAGQLEWKRPVEIRSNPVLLSEGTTRFDIGQGSFGTCWFLSMVSVIADRPKLMKRVLPKDAYKGGQPDYDGIFHCRFWRFGVWDDVYTDDYLPIIYGDRYYGAHSATDDNETWPSLLEKGFARLYGSYNTIQGGLVQDAYINLTGGVAEMINIKEEVEKNTRTKDDMFYRLCNALHSGAMACCDVPQRYNDTHGLVGGHAYSMTDALEVNGNKLVRVRNPWGKTEWTGPWSDGSPEWESIQGQVQAPNKDDGEFYMSFDHFLTYFDTITICSMTPDFDRDGDKSDGLNYTTCLYGQWQGDEAAGFQKKIQNPKYIFKVGDDAVDSHGKVPIVVQLIQRTKRRKDNKPSIRCDLYKVMNKETNDQVVLMALGKDNNNYRSEMQVCYRFHVTPGEYCCVPSTIEEGIEKEFMVRVFTSGPVSNIRYIRNDITIHEITESPELGQDKIQCLVGEWVTGVNAGGQVAHPTFHTNPQFHVDVPNYGGDVTVSFYVTQEAVEPKYPVGFKLFKRNGASIPVSQDWLYENWDDSVTMTTGEKSVFIIANCTPELKYRLPPGEYLAIIHADTAEQQKKFTVTAFSDNRIDVTGHQLS